MITEVSCPKNSIYNVSKILFGFFFITLILAEFNSNQYKIEDADGIFFGTKATGFIYCEQNRNSDLGWFWAGWQYQKRIGPIMSNSLRVFFFKFSEANEIL